MFNTVLFSIDQSREAQEAVATVANIVKTYKSRLVLLSVVEKEETKETLPDAKIMTSTEAVAQLLQQAQELFALKGVETEIIERSGVPSFTICDVADEINANLIVMGCRGLGLTQAGAVESVTNRVINLSPCPVLIIP